MQDSDIIKLFYNRSEDAIRELDEKYGKLCKHIANNILHDEQQVQECINDAYFGMWNSIPPNNPNPLRAYLCKIVRNISVKRYRDNHTAKRFTEYEISINELGDCIPDKNSVEDIVRQKELTKLIETFLQKIDSKDRIMFVRRYWYAESVKNIANSFGISERNASMKLFRIRKKLRLYLEETGVSI
jgi:RNA polymerase sigma-70 factor (ECF subfamily)